MVEALLGIQIIATSFAGFMLYVAFLHFKKGNISPVEFYFWVVTWFAFIFFALFPRVLDPILSTLFIARAMDLLMIVAFMILTVLGFFNHLSIKKMQHQLEKMIRSDSFKNAKKS